MKLLVDKIVPKSNLLEEKDLPNLELPIYNGSLSISFGFEQAISATLSLEAVHTKHIDTVRSIYNQIDKRINIYNHACVVKSYSDVVQRIYSDGKFSVEAYNVSVSLGSWWEFIASNPVKINSTRTLSSSLTLKIGITALSELSGVPYIGPYFEFEIPTNSDKNYTTSLLSEVSKYARLQNSYVSYTNIKGLELRKLSDHTYWELDESDLLYSVQVSSNKAPSFIDANLGTFDTDPTLQDRPLIATSTKYIIQSPVYFTSIEGEDASVPPRGDYITDSSSVADASGPRKTQKQVTTVNGNPLEEQVITYGFIYTAEEVSVDEPGKPIKGSASGYWTELENYYTQYLYEPASPPGINTKIVDNKTGKLITAYFLNNSAFSGYLRGANFYVGSVTIGKKQHRYIAETSVKDMRDYMAGLAEARSANDQLEIKYYNALILATQWKDLKFSSGSNLELAYYAEYYNATEDIPYVIQKALPYDIFGTYTTNLEQDSDGFVYLLIADPNYTPKLFVLNEASYSSSYSSIDNPENIRIKDEYDNASNEDKPYIIFRPPLSTGEESYSITKRSITAIQPASQGVTLADESFYTEYTNTSRSGEANFGVASTNISNKTIPGKPPGASSYRDNYIPLTDKTQYRPFNNVFVTSDNLNRYSNSSESFNFPTRYITDAVKAVSTELSIRHLLNTLRTSVQVAWFYPYIREGDILDIYGTEASGNNPKKVIDVNYTIAFNGILQDGTIVATCDGVSLNLGEYVERKVTYRTEVVSNRGISQNLNIQLGFAPSGNVAFPTSGGRRFSP